MTRIDLWNGKSDDYMQEITSVSCAFYPDSGEYRGNLYINGVAVGDFVSNDSLELEKIFPTIFEE